MELGLTQQEAIDEWNKARGFEPSHVGYRVIHSGFNRKARRNGSAKRWMDEQQAKVDKIRRETEAS